MTDGDPPPDQLVGGWSLRSWVSLGDDGSEVRPMGDSPFGLLIYTADGTMVGVMGRGDRPRFASDDVTGGSAAEQAAAFATCVAYGGTYEVEGGSITHRVEVSLFPNWIGTEQQRAWRISDDGRQLTLTSRPLVFGGATRIQRLVWERRDPG